jgi:hypothetical protein
VDQANAPQDTNDQIVWDANQGPTNPTQAQGYGDLVSGGKIDRTLPAGSRLNPTGLQPDGSAPPAGTAYVDAAGALQPNGAPDTLTDAGKSAWGGLMSGVGGMADAATSAMAGGAGQQALADKITSMIMPSYRPAPIPRLTDVTDAIGGAYAPQSNVGRVTRALGEFTPNAFLGGESLAAKAGQVVIPALTSQGAEAVARGAGADDRGQQIAGFVGALAGGIGATRGLAGAARPAAETSRAANTISNFMNLGGDTLASMAPRLQDGDLPAAAAPGVHSLTDIVANAAGAGSIKVRQAAQARLADMPSRVMGLITDTLGVDPKAARGDMGDLVKQGQATAKPLFDQALGDNQPVWNPTLEALSKRPKIAAAIKAASADARSNGVDPNGEGFTFMENPPSEMDNGAPPIGTPAKAGGIKAPPQTSDAEWDAAASAVPVPDEPKPPNRGPSLLQFIAGQGGMSDDGGELAAMGADKWHVGKPFQPKLVNPAGPGADRMAETAADAGYFTPKVGADGYPDTPGPDDLHAAIQREMGGKPVFAREAEPADQAKYEAAVNARQAAIRANNPTGDSMFDPQGPVSPSPALSANDGPVPAAYQAQAPMPDSEPVAMAQPTARTWNTVRETLGNMVERHPLTNQVLPDSESAHNKAVFAENRALTAELAGDKNGAGAAIPGLRPALDASSDYLGPAGAYNRMSGQLFRGSVGDFQDTWNSARNDTERAAMRGALGNDALEAYHGANGLQPGAFRGLGVRQKLGIAFPDTADSFADGMDQLLRDKQAYGQIVGNSATPMRLAGQELLKHEVASTAPKITAADVASLALSSHSPAAMLFQGGRMAVKALAKSAPRLNAVEDPATNAALGDALSDPAAFESLMRQSEAINQANARNALARSRALRFAPRLALPATFDASKAKASPANASLQTAR